ncbi:type I restriction endonuclease subunit R [Candidatus Dependentiae bacterium]|nr:type I restriction endonuclease subunit R [Candidatus Dependentiae bacterium]
MFEGPEKKFQNHIAKFLLREHHYSLLDQTDITDTDYYIAEEHLITFIKTTQKQTYQKLEEQYSADARNEILRSLKKELQFTPLWLIIRQGLTVRDLEFKLFYPKPRSKESIANEYYKENRIAFKDELQIKDSKRPDFVLYLNGLPIITIELKHEKNQTLHDAVHQYACRNHTDKIFQLPFIHIAADNSDVMIATDPSVENNFRWYNSGLTNERITDDEYPIEYLYRNVLSQESIFEMLSFYLIYVPVKDNEKSFTIFPRYHQSRMVNKVENDILEHYTKTNNLGKKYLINHSAGSGKTLSICWLADKLHSLYNQTTNEKAVNMIFILTDRKSLDKNIRDDMDKFTHLKDIAAYAKKSSDLKKYICETKEQIIVSTIQKFDYILEEIKNNQELKSVRVAFLLDEAHRSQEGKMGTAIRAPFRDKDVADDTDETESDDEENIARIIKAYDHNQMFVAFTATPSPATLQLFGEPFDIYSESEAITEGYILDVAENIISYQTLYNLHCSFIPNQDDEKLYPKGVVAKALKNVAYQDSELIQYKSEVMLRIFEEKIKPLINGKAKAMIVTSSRIAGLTYFNIIKKKLEERHYCDYKALYAFSDFTLPDTNELITEYAVNELNPGEDIEERFEKDEYRIMIVANKFQTGFDQPLLAGMFLDKPVMDRNAVQTVSRLNRCHNDKKSVVVVDFTNNAKAIMKAFKKYRKGKPFEETEPDKEKCVQLYNEIMAYELFTNSDAEKIVELLAENEDAQIQYFVNALRNRFNNKIHDSDNRKEFVYLLERFVKSYYFLACFFQYSNEINKFAVFSEYVGSQLIKIGTVSDLMKRMRNTQVVKAYVKYTGEVRMPDGQIKTKGGGQNQGGKIPIKKISVQDMINEIKEKFKITDEEALYIKKITDEKIQDTRILNTIELHKDDTLYLENTYSKQINKDIQDAFEDNGKVETLVDPKYIEPGAIIDIMAYLIIQFGLQRSRLVLK